MNDDDLRDRFRDLRRHDERAAPDFQQMWSAPRRAHSPLRTVVPIALGFAAAAVVLVWCGSRVLDNQVAFAPPATVAPTPMPAEPLDPAPLDFLLETPGASALSIAPDLGSGDSKEW